jgi:hypothetical protein
MPCDAGVMTAYWWYVLVPAARVNLAVNKKSGKLRAYLEELKAGPDTASLHIFSGDLKRRSPILET